MFGRLDRLYKSRGKESRVKNYTVFSENIVLLVAGFSCFSKSNYIMAFIINAGTAHLLLPRPFLFFCFPFYQRTILVAQRKLPQAVTIISLFFVATSVTLPATRCQHVSFHDTSTFYLERPRTPEQSLFEVGQVRFPHNRAAEEPRIESYQL